MANDMELGIETMVKEDIEEELCLKHGFFTNSKKTGE